MKALITGARGTVGRVLRQTLENAGHTVVAWDRSLIPIDDYHAMEGFVREVEPDVVYHLAIASVPTGREGESWLVNYEWSSELAWITRILGIRLVFASTAMVFSNDAKGPFTIESEPDAEEGYGYEKRRAEERVRYQNPEATLVRLGWQIGDAAGSNNMIDFLVNKSRENGGVQASIKWYPATSFLGDTADALVRLAGMPPSLYMLDSNRSWTFYEIAHALNRRHGGRWRIEPSADFVYDQRMQDDRIVLPPLSDHLSELS